MSNPYNVRMTEALAIPASIVPQVASAGSINTDAFDLGKVGRALFIVELGALGASTTVDFKLQAAPATDLTGGTAGTYTDVTNFAIVQLTASTKIAILEISTEQLVAADVAAGLPPTYRQFVRGVLTVTGAGTAAVSVMCLATHGRHQPESSTHGSWTLQKSTVQAAVIPAIP